MDLLDVSSGGVSPKQKIKGGPFAYQATFAEDVKKAHGDKILVSAVGAITTGKLAQEVLDKVRLRIHGKNDGATDMFACRDRQMSYSWAASSRRTPHSCGQWQRN